MKTVACVRRRLRDESGYSLVELLTVLAILGTVIGALVTVFVSGSNAEASLNSRFQAQLRARLALDQIRRELHCASALTVNSTASVTVTLPTPTAGTPSCPTGVGAFTWRTCSVTASRYAFYRIPGANAACGAAGALREADYLVNPLGAAFPIPTVPAGLTSPYYAPSTSALGRLHIQLSVNPIPTKPGTYTLTDDIVLLNTVRG